LYDIQMSNGFVMGENFTPKIFFENLALVLVVTNFIALIVAWPLAKYVVYIQKLPAKLFKILIWSVLIWALYTVGEKNFQEAYYLIVFFVLAPVGYLLRKFDTMPLIFTFIIGERLLYIFNTMKALYL
jgi:TctA family transporter